MDQEEINRKLRKASKNNPVIESVVSGLIENWETTGDLYKGNLNEDHLNRFEIILKLISCNIKLSADHKNFDTNEYRIDKSTVFNYKMKYQTTGEISKEEMIALNLLYQKHKKISDILLR